MVTVELTVVETSTLTGATRVRRTVRARSVEEALAATHATGATGVLVVSVEQE